MLGGITANWIPSDSIRAKILDATWSYRHSMLGVQDLIMSSHRTLRFLTVTSSPCTLGSYGGPMFIRQSKNRNKMISSVKETHQHIINLRQVPPPVNEMGFTPSPQYNCPSPSNRIHDPPTAPGFSRTGSAGNNQSCIHDNGTPVGIPIASLNRFSSPTAIPPHPTPYPHPTPHSQWIGNPRYPPPPIPCSNYGVEKTAGHSSGYVHPTPYYNHWNGNTVILPIPNNGRPPVPCYVNKDDSTLPFTSQPSTSHQPPVQKHQILNSPYSPTQSPLSFPQNVPRCHDSTTKIVADDNYIHVHDDDDDVDDDDDDAGSIVGQRMLDGDNTWYDEDCIIENVRFIFEKLCCNIF